MVVCNICRKNKDWREMKGELFRYVCEECWKGMEIYIDGEKVDKELMY